MATKATNIEELRPYMPAGAYLEDFEVIECALLYYREFADCFLLSSSREPGSGLNYLYLQLEEDIGLSDSQKEPLRELDNLVNELHRALSDAIHKSWKADSTSVLDVKKATSAGNERFLVTAVSANRWINQQYGEERAAHFAELLGIETSEGEPISLQSTSENGARPAGQSDQAQSTGQPADWRDIRLDLRTNNRMAVFHKNRLWREFDISTTALVDKKTKELSEAGKRLEGLAEFETLNLSDFTHPLPKDRTAISKLRTALKSITGIKGVPITHHNKSDGYVAKFEVRDRRNAKNEREEASFRTVVLDDRRDRAASGWNNNDSGEADDYDHCESTEVWSGQAEYAEYGSESFEEDHGYDPDMDENDPNY